eukprot:s912_g11.t1
MEEPLAKSGPELFRELKRIYAVAQVEDYFKNGVWRDDLMRTDLQLIAVHRREAGAPEAPELSEVELPPLPPGAAAAASTSLAAASGLGDSVADLRLIALFVAKWKLDVAATKKALIKLLPMRRRYVMAHFKAKGGPDVNEELEQYIQECGSTNSWAAAMVQKPTASWPVASSVNGAMGLPPGANRVRPPLTITPRKPGPTNSAGVIASSISQRLAAIRAQGRPAGMVQRAPMGGIGSSGAVDTAELRLVNLFVAKWKLNPARTRAALGKVLPLRRRQVIASFRAEVGRGDLNDQLDRYISERQANGWDASRNGSVGVKRPITAVSAASTGFDPNKRIRPITAPRSTGVSSPRPASPVATPRMTLPPGPRPRSAGPSLVLARPTRPTGTVARVAAHTMRPVGPLSTVRGSVGSMAHMAPRAAVAPGAIRPKARPTGAANVRSPYRPSSPGPASRPIRSASAPIFQATRYK